MEYGAGSATGQDLAGQTGQYTEIKDILTYVKSPPWGTFAYNRSEAGLFRILPER